MADSPMTYMANDHDRLERILTEVTQNPGAVDLERYEEFRKGLLRHIGIEEKILFPLVLARGGQGHAPLLARLRLDHGAIAALLVPRPSMAVIATLRSILSLHNEVEEKTDGVYQVGEFLAGEEAAAVLESMRSAPQVPSMPMRPLSDVIDATRRAVARAGYAWSEG